MGGWPGWRVWPVAGDGSGVVEDGVGEGEGRGRGGCSVWGWGGWGSRIMRWWGGGGRGQAGRGERGMAWGLEPSAGSGSASAGRAGGERRESLKGTGSGERQYWVREIS